MASQRNTRDLFANIELEMRIILLIDRRVRMLDRLIEETVSLFGWVDRQDCYGRIDFLANRGCIDIHGPVGPSNLVSVSLSPLVPHDGNLLGFLYHLHVPEPDLALP